MDSDFFRLSAVPESADSWKTLYQEAARQFDDVDHALYEAMYGVAHHYPKHDDYPKVYAKLHVIDAAYSANLRKQDRSKAASPIDLHALARDVSKRAAEVDALIERAWTITGSLKSTYIDCMKSVVKDFVLLLGSSKYLNGAEMYSFASKYLQVHAPNVVVFDGNAKAALSKWSGQKVKDYRELADQFSLLYRELGLGKTGDPKRLDFFLFHAGRTLSSAFRSRSKKIPGIKKGRI